MKTGTFSFFFVFIFFLSGCGGSPPNTTAPSGPSLIDQWAADDLTEITIHTDLTTLFAGNEAAGYQHALMSWADRTFTVELRSRGETRRRVCDFPPLKLNFKKEELQAAGLDARFDKVKLVTECTTDESLVLREYLAYRLYEQLTDYSFRTRLARVHYIDSGKLRQDITQYAILLEPDEEMADRLGGQLLAGVGRLRTINSEQYCLLTVFQYMIGNTDWSLDHRHNIRLLQLAEGAPLPVPYDFDYAGLVNAPYAAPPPQLPVDNVRERFFQWRGKDERDLEKTLQLFHEQKPGLLNLVEQLEPLSSGARQDARAYLESFFEIIESREKMESELFVNVSERTRNIS